MRKEISIKDHEHSIWWGVYEKFKDVPRNCDVFNSDVWIKKQQKHVLSLLKDMESGKPLSGNVAREYPLADAVEKLFLKKKNVTVVDYGGSMGQTYIDLISRTPDIQNNVIYTVVETEGVCNSIPAKLSEYPGLSFISNVDNAKGKKDIVHLGSALQYIDDWRSLLSDFQKRFDPDMFVLSDLLVGNVPSFVSSQIYYGSLIPVRFININEFLGFWQKTPYEIVLQRDYSPLGKERYFPANALPKTHQIKSACHMVFSKTKGRQE